jgi:hypothetical protein
VVENASLAEFPIKSVDIRHDEAIRRPVAGVCPLLGVVPLKVKFHAISHDRRIPGILSVVSECSDETQLLIEADGRSHVAGSQDWMNGIDARLHGSLLEVLRTTLPLSRPAARGCAARPRA